jgi:peptidoglycan hydrolase-like protein with peptidoglycan-binding domain
VALLAAGGLSAQGPSTAQKKAPTAKKSTYSKTTSKSPVAKKVPVPAVADAKTGSVAKPASTVARRRSSKPAKTAVASRKYTPQQPTPERLKEIQQALADRGYFSGSVDGTWGPASIEALKRFQREQSLTDDGKIGSLSLIALGLGPKRVVSAETAIGDRQAQQQR